MTLHKGSIEIGEIAINWAWTEDLPYRGWTRVFGLLIEYPDCKPGGLLIFRLPVLGTETCK